MSGRLTHPPIISDTLHSNWNGLAKFDGFSGFTIVHKVDSRVHQHHHQKPTIRQLRAIIITIFTGFANVVILAFNTTRHFFTKTPFLRQHYEFWLVAHTEVKNLKSPEDVLFGSFVQVLIPLSRFFSSFVQVLIPLPRLVRAGGAK